jgi:hypothetical protein
MLINFLKINFREKKNFDDRYKGIIGSGSTTSFIYTSLKLKKKKKKFNLILNLNFKIFFFRK